MAQTRSQDFHPAPLKHTEEALVAHTLVDADDLAPVHSTVLGARPGLRPILHLLVLDATEKHEHPSHNLRGGCGLEWSCRRVLILRKEAKGDVGVAVEVPEPVPVRVSRYYDVPPYVMKSVRAATCCC